MKLTDHFDSDEFIHSGDSVPDEDWQNVHCNMLRLCETVLEPIRSHFNAPITIHSGYRSPEHNKAVGGVPTSYHLYAGDHAAADFGIDGHSYVEVFDWIRLKSELPFDEVILEADHTTARPACVHIQINLNPRRTALVGETHGTSRYTQVEVV